MNQTYDIGIGRVDVVSDNSGLGKCKVVIQFMPNRHVRTIRTEMLDGRVSLIVAVNSEAANTLRQQAIDER